MAAVDHSRWMRRCLQLAERAAGQTAPNPMVGAVVVGDDDTVLGEGFHPGAGQPHAEVYALAAAGERARGARLYVNLEPCNHQGRTPPCTEAIIAAGVRQVIAGMVDPDPRVSGGGIERLRGAGVEVILGVEGDACQRLNAPFVHRVVHQRPLGILKYAMTLDGKIATATGHSAWVTGPEARARVHRLRSTCDAVIVGGNTVRRDDPRLTTHGQSYHNPLRVVMSRRLDLPEAANLWDVSVAKTLVLTGPEASRSQQQRLGQLGVEVVRLDALEPAPAMNYLGQRGCLSVLWECGGTLAARAIAAGTVQQIWAFVAPKIIGGAQAPSPVGELHLEQMTQALELAAPTVTQIGPDLLIRGDLAQERA